MLAQQDRVALGVIELQGIRKRFGAMTALGDVSIQISPGEAVAVVGESGSGKTTLGRILLRLINPDAGRYLFEGCDVLRLRGSNLKRWRRDVQAVFQNPWQSLNPRLRVDYLITEPLAAVKGLSEREFTSKAGDLLELVGLPAQLGRRYPHQLSGGQRQRVAIARAVSVHPKFIVLDEPASALDISVRAQILNLLKSLIAQFGITVLYITHDLATVPYLCSRAYVLYQGLVFEQLSARNLVSQPDNPYAKMLLDSVLRVGVKTPLPDPSQEVLVDRPIEGCPFAPRCPHVQLRCRELESELIQIQAAWQSRCHFAGGPKPMRVDVR